jgi:hypothetical protein
LSGFLEARSFPVEVTPFAASDDTGTGAHETAGGRT